MLGFLFLGVHWMSALAQSCGRHPVLAPLARETGLLVVAAFVLAATWRREWKHAVLFAAAAVPAIAWQLFVFARTGPVKYETSLVPFAAVWRAIVEPVRYQGYPTALAWTGMALQYVALAGAVIAIMLAFSSFEKGKPAGGAAITAMLFAFLNWRAYWAALFDEGKQLYNKRGSMLR